ncbi:MAG: chorismate synthase [Erysipelotrichaceae bacterium]|nr:chorismate synthase [Erysipelotrichaceae bacterium]
MKNTFGSNVSVTLFGESHGQAIGAVIDGLPAGFFIDLDLLNQDMDKRKAKGAMSTRRREADEVRFLSGFFEGRTTGTPLTLLIENKTQRSADYAALKYRLRPGHADWSAFEKYGGYQDYRGGGHFSGRLTAPIVAAGSICRQILSARGVEIGSHIESLHAIEDEKFSADPVILRRQVLKTRSMDFAVLDESAAVRMEEAVLAAAKELDSVGGVLETAVIGMPAGIGEPFFDSVESVLAHLLFSMPAVKGVSFGLGFGFASLKGSQANDPISAKNGILSTSTNNNAGINGGITNGMPIVIHTCIKPTPSIYKPQASVDYSTKENVTLEIKGRHDPAIIHRARIVADSLVAIGLLDLWMEAEGTRAFEQVQEAAA